MRKGETDTKVLGRELGVRVLYCHMLASQLEDAHISLAEFGERVAREERRLDKANAPTGNYSASTVSRWENGEHEPGLLAILAITEIVNRALASAGRRDRIDPGWVAFGQACSVVAPEMPTFTLSSLLQTRSGGRRGSRG